MNAILYFLQATNMGFAENLEKEHASWCEKHQGWKSFDGPKVYTKINDLNLFLCYISQHTQS